MRQEGKSGVPTLGVMAAAIVLFLTVFFFFSRHHCWRVCVHVLDFFFFLALLCNAVSDLGKNMCQRDVGRAEGGLSECMTTSTSVSSLTAQLAARALPIQLFLPPSSVRMYRLQVRCEA